MASTSPANPKHTALAIGSRKVDLLLAHYYANHTHPSNERIHLVSTPLNLFSVLGVLYAVYPWLAVVFIALSLLYYARLSIEFCIAMAITLLAMLVLAGILGALGVLWALSFSAFAGAWLLQDYGHQIEGKKPSAMEDVQYFWVGHLFVLSKLFFKWGIRW
jgi:uncharacterized membrane protein YGL010W